MTEIKPDGRISIAGANHDSALRSVEWLTPPEVVEALGVEFDLDPCAPPGGVPWIPASHHYSREENGLVQPWRGRVFLNPPYGREAPRWIERLIEHGDGIALVFARTDARWAQSAIARAGAVCLIAGRLAFIDGNGVRERRQNNAGLGSMLLAYGAECARAVKDSGLGVTFNPDAR